MENRINHKILESLMDTRKRRGTSVGSGAPLIGVCLTDPGHSPKAREKQVWATAPGSRDRYTDQCACSNELSALASEERPI